MEFHATNADSNFGLTKVQHKVRRLCSDEKEKVLVQINLKSLLAWKKMLSTWWWKWSYVSLSTPTSLMQSMHVIEY